MKGKGVSVLVDNGSTNNFIQDNIVEFLELPIEEIPAFEVCVGSGATISCDGVCRRVPYLFKM